jgi:ankyrin repeat protein
MPDWRARRITLLALLVGLVCAALTGLGGVVAAVAGWLAQPAFAVAVRREAADRRAGGLAILWGVGLLAAAGLMAWPLTSVDTNTPGLGDVLVISALAGIGLIALWRLWPAWHALETGADSLAAAWHELDLREASAWRGLGAASLIGVVLASVVFQAWPGTLNPNLHWLLAAIAALVWPGLHWLLQGIRSADAVPTLHAFLQEIPADAETVFDGDPDAGLYAAARAGRVDQALALLEAGADPRALPPAGDRDQRSLPVLAAVLPDLRLLRALIGAGVDVNAAHAGMTPLLAATRDSWHGRPEAVMTLLANGANPRAGDADGNTPLHHAARSSDPGVAALLRDAAAELDVLNNDAVTPLGMACAAGNWRLARFLLERGAKPEPGGATPALLAAAGSEEDDAAGVQLLLKHKARIDARDAGGRSALHEAAAAGNDEALAALLIAGAKLDVIDAGGRTPLLDAIAGGHVTTVDALLAAGADINAVDGEGRSALALACLTETASTDLVRNLLALGASPTQPDTQGKRPVDHAAAAGRWTQVALLDPAYPLPSRVADDAPSEPLPDRAPLSLLRESLLQPPYTGVESLLRVLSPADLGSLLIDPDAQAPVDRLQWLLDHGADADVRDGLSDTALFTLLARGSAALPALQTLLRRGASPAGAGGLARFLSACATEDQAGRGLEQFAQDLIERGADWLAPSTAGDPPLALSVRLGWSRLAERLVAAGANLEARDSHGMTALHLAAALGRESMLKLLVASGASPQTRAADGQTPLGVALATGRRDLADWLDWRGWPLPMRALHATDVPAAAIVGDADAVRRLLDLDMPVDTTDAQGCTALLRAAGGGHRSTVDLLLARGADPGRAALTGATPLSAAVSMRHGEIVDRLLAGGADLEQRLPGDVTVLMVAAALGLPDVCARLLMAGAQIQARDAQGLTPLHCATLFGFTASERPRLMALLDTLLLAGAEPDAAAGHITPLLLLLGVRAEPGTPCVEEVILTGTERLLDEDVALDVQDPRGFGPLHLAALHGLLQVTQRLLRAGCDPDLRDTLNRTPREIAVMRGFIDVAAEFAPIVSGVSMARFLREPR